MFSTAVQKPELYQNRLERQFLSYERYVHHPAVNIPERLQAEIEITDLRKDTASVFT